MNNLIKAIEKAGEFSANETIKARNREIGKGDSLLFYEGAKHQHSEIQWAVEGLKIAVEALKDYRGRVGYRTAAQWQKAIGEDKGQWDIFSDKALEQIAALVPKGEK